jgi:hypothetical protein
MSSQKLRKSKKPGSLKIKVMSSSKLAITKKQLRATLRPLTTWTISTVKMLLSLNRLAS